jgi:hypothetical protein
MRFPFLQNDSDPHDERQADSRPPGSFQSERWPRTPRVLRWAWGAGVTVMVVSQLAGGGGLSDRDLIRIIHTVSELLDKGSDPPPVRIEVPLAPAAPVTPPPAAAPAAPPEETPGP